MLFDCLISICIVRKSGWSIINQNNERKVIPPTGIRFSVELEDMKTTGERSYCFQRNYHRYTFWLIVKQFLSLQPIAP